MIQQWTLKIFDPQINVRSENEPLLRILERILALEKCGNVSKHYLESTFLSEFMLDVIFPLFKTLHK